MDKIQKRQIAYKIRVNDILKGEYVKEEGEWVPNYINVGDKKVSRVSLVAVVVSKQSSDNTNYANILIDDGSGKISIRSFEEGNNFGQIEIGNFVLVVGRPREYMDEKYIVAEIMKKIENPGWVEVRKLELGQSKVLDQDNNCEVNITQEKEIKEDVKEQVKVEEIDGGDADDINAKIFNLIKEVDQGNGADTQEVITKSNIEEAEKIITGLLEQGEVFEIKPGKLKVLE